MTNFKNIYSLIALTVILGVVLACSTEGTKKASAEVDVFHERFNSGKFVTIYNDSSDEFKSSVSQSNLEQILSSVKQTMGNFQEAKQTSWKHNTGADGEIITLSFDTTFANGPGTEEFMYKIIDDKAKLFNYKVNSPLMEK